MATWVKLRQLSALTGLEQRQLRKLIKDGKVESMLIGATILVQYDSADPRWNDFIQGAMAARNHGKLKTPPRSREIPEL